MMRRACNTAPVLALVALAATLGAQAQTHTPERAPIVGRLTVDRDGIYVGEVFHLELVVYSDGPDLAQSPSLSDLPAEVPLEIGDFEAMALDADDTWNGRRQIRRYRARAEATAAGTFTLDLDMQGALMMRHSGLFSQIRIRPSHIPMPPLTLTILAVPTAEAPPDFSGAVGQYTFQTDLSTNAATPGDLVKLTSTVRAAERVPPIEVPRIASDAHFRAYPVRELTSGDPRVRIFEQTIIPRSLSSGTVPPLTFSYFDPRARSFRSLRQGPFTLDMQQPTSAPSDDKGREEQAATAMQLDAFADFQDALQPVDGLADEAAALVARLSTSYANADYLEAVDAARQAVATASPSSALYFNTANALLQAGRSGEAILYYLRALREDPGNADAQANLTLARHVAELPPVPPADPSGRLLRAAPRAYAGAFAGGLLVCGLAALLHRRGYPCTAAGLTCVGIALAATGIAGLCVPEPAPVAIAIQSGPARFGPSHVSQPLFPVREGVALRIVEEYGAWTRVRLGPDTGWVQHEHIQRIAPTPSPAATAAAPGSERPR